MMRNELINRVCRSAYPELDAWIAKARLDSFAKYAKTQLGVDVEATTHLYRYLTQLEPAAMRVEELLAPVQG